MTMDPAVAEIEADYPGWHVWRGPGGLWYARRPMSSPPVVRRARILSVLRMRVAVKDAEIRARLAGRSAAALAAAEALDTSGLG